MEFRNLGSSGIKLSVLSFGSWVTFNDQIDEDVAYSTMKAAYDEGVNFFDNAEVYSQGASEIMMGRIIKKAGWRRSDLVLSTKIFWGGDGINDKGLSMKHIYEGTHAALKRLQTDYVDLIFCHRPDLHTPIEETVRAMSNIITQGKAFYWGTSEWSAEQIRKAYDFAIREHLVPPTMEQPEYNMFHRTKIEKEFNNLYKEIGLGTTIWSPLASGVLTGKYKEGIPDGSRLSLKNYDWLRARFETPEGKEKIRKASLLEIIAKELGISLAQLSLAWCAKNKNVSTVITGASNPNQVIENMKALSFIELLTDDIVEKIEEILNNKPVLEADWRIK